MPFHNCKKLLRSSAYLLGLFDRVCRDMKRIASIRSEFTDRQDIICWHTDMHTSCFTLLQSEEKWSECFWTV